MKIRLGIFLGGSSQEREQSFASGRMVYDNVEQSIFQPVPIFVDSLNNWILLDWLSLYKSSILDLISPATLANNPNDFPIYIESLHGLDQVSLQSLLKKIGQPIEKNDLKNHIDLALSVLEEEDASNTILKDSLLLAAMPFVGCEFDKASLATKTSELNKGKQEWGCSKILTVEKKDWLSADVYSLYKTAEDKIGFPLVIRAAKAIGLSRQRIIKKEEGLEGFEYAMNAAFFRELIPLDEWQDRSTFERIEFVKLLSDPKDGLGFPLHVSLGAKSETIHHPAKLLTFLDTETLAAEHLSQLFILETIQNKGAARIENIVEGKRFSTIVIRTEDGSVIAFAPQEIDLNTGHSQKELTFSPLQLPIETLKLIRKKCETLFSKLETPILACIDGVYTNEGSICIMEVKTQPSILRNSLLLHQFAGIGLNTSQFLNWLIHNSMKQGILAYPEQEKWSVLYAKIEKYLKSLPSIRATKKQIAVIVGGSGIERQMSLNTGQNIYEKLSTSANYEPVPVLLIKKNNQQLFFQLPIQFWLEKDVDNIINKIHQRVSNELQQKIRRECAKIINKYIHDGNVFEAKELRIETLAHEIDGVFIALHGSEGESGELQMQLKKHHLPYNGSGVKTTSTVIDKFRTLQFLGKHGLSVPEQLLLSKQDFQIEETSFYSRIEQQFEYPFIAKPVDNSSQTFVRIIKKREELHAYAHLLFNIDPENKQNYKHRLKIRYKEELPKKGEILFEQLITKGKAIHLLRIKSCLLTKYTSSAKLDIDFFEPSEITSNIGEEEKHITPARFAVGKFSHEHVLKQVKYVIERAVRLLEIENYCCVEAFIKILPNGKVETLITEVNSLPPLTPSSPVFSQALKAGYKPGELINEILSFSFKRTEKNHGIKVLPLQEEKTLETSTIAVSSQITTLHSASNTDELPMKNTPSSPNKPWALKLSRTMNGIKKLIKSPYFLKNIGAMFAVVIIGFLLLNMFLNLYTGHGNSVQVENYTGLHIDDASKKAKSRGFKISVNQAPFSLDITPGEVIDQEPVALNRIKKNRTIYLTIIGDPQPRGIPAFRDAADDYKQYAPKLKSLQIKSVVKEEVFDAKLAQGTILYFFYRGKKYTPNDVNRGVKVQQGSTLEFVITKNKDDNVRLPSLRCKKYSEVAFLLPSLELQIGKVEGDFAVKSDAYIVAQEPTYSPGAKILRGSTINLRLQNELPQGCQTEIEINEPESDSGGLPDSDTELPSLIDTLDEGF